MRQRVGIALALALEPALVILDEPTTALDVIVEREILEQIRELQRRLGFSVLFITHDLARMLQFSDRVAVFYARAAGGGGAGGRAARRPRHPYTQGLLRAFPSRARRRRGAGEHPRRAAEPARTRRRAAASTRAARWRWTAAAPRSRSLRDAGRPARRRLPPGG